MIEKPEVFGQFEKVGPLISDTLTGLQWQVGPDLDITWDDAKEWVESLGGDWRMPTQDEIRQLWDAGVSSDDWGPFENSGWQVWSVDTLDSVWAWNLGFGFPTGYESWGYRSNAINSRAFAVRTNSETLPSLISISTGSIEGRVSDHRGRPLSEVSLRAIGLNQTYTTLSRDGSFSFTVLPSGVYTLEAARRGYDSVACESILVEPGGVVVCNFDNASGTSLKETVGLISGIVETSDGIPLIGATVLVVDTQWGAMTNTVGEYTIRFPVEGSYTLIGRMIGYNDRTSPGLEVHSGEEIVFNFSVDNPNSEDPRGYSLPLGSAPIMIIRPPHEYQPECFSVSEGVITDPESGLQWQVGPDRDMTWDEAKEWADGLWGSWRLPTREELRGLRDAGLSCSNWGPFKNSGYSVWSGEVYDSTSAWFISYSWPGSTEHWRRRNFSFASRVFTVRSR